MIENNENKILTFPSKLCRQFVGQIVPTQPEKKFIRNYILTKLKLRK